MTIPDALDPLLEAVSVPVLLAGSLDVEPVPAPRPRVSGGRAYYPEGYVETKTAIRALLVHLRNRTRGGEWDRMGSFGLAAIFRRRSGRAADLDNLLKTLLDGATGALWNDDRDVVEVRARVERAIGDRGEILLAVWRT